MQQVKHNAKHSSKHQKWPPQDAYSTIISFRLVRQCFKSTLCENSLYDLVEQIGLINDWHSTVTEPPSNIADVASQRCFPLCSTCRIRFP